MPSHHHHHQQQQQQQQQRSREMYHQHQYQQPPQNKHKRHHHHQAASSIVSNSMNSKLSAFQSALLEQEEEERSKSCLQRLSPLESPLLWINILTIIAGYSAVMMLLEIQQRQANNQNPKQEDSYVVFDVLTTIVWFFMTGCNWIYNQHRSRETNTIEVLVGILFLLLTIANVYTTAQFQTGQLHDDTTATNNSNTYKFTSTILLFTFICFFLELLDTVRVFQKGGWKGEYQPEWDWNNDNFQTASHYSINTSNRYHDNKLPMTPSSVASSRRNPSETIPHRNNHNYTSTATVATTTTTTMNNNNNNNSSNNHSPIARYSSPSAGYQQNYYSTSENTPEVLNVDDETDYDNICAACGKTLRKCRCGCSKEILQSVKQLSPPGSPLLWAVLNAFFAAYSALLLWLVYEVQTMNVDTVVTTTTATAIYTFAQQNYLIYDFSTTLFWCWEALLNWIFIHQLPSSRISVGRSPWMSRIEAFLAVVFLAGSVYNLYRWKELSVKQPDIAPAAVLLNILAYLVAFAESLNMVKYKETRQLQRLQQVLLQKRQRKQKQQQKQQQQKLYQPQDYPDYSQQQQHQQQHQQKYYQQQDQFSNNSKLQASMSLGANNSGTYAIEEETTITNRDRAAQTPKKHSQRRNANPRTSRKQKTNLPKPKRNSATNSRKQQPHQQQQQQPVQQQRPQQKLTDHRKPSNSQRQQQQQQHYYQDQQQQQILEETAKLLREQQQLGTANLVGLSATHHNSVGSHQQHHTQEQQRIMDETTNLLREHQELSSGRNYHQHHPTRPTLARSTPRR